MEREVIKGTTVQSNAVQQDFQKESLSFYPLFLNKIVGLIRLDLSKNAQSIWTFRVGEESLVLIKKST